MQRTIVTTAVAAAASVPSSFTCSGSYDAIIENIFPVSHTLCTDPKAREEASEHVQRKLEFEDYEELTVCLNMVKSH